MAPEGATEESKKRKRSSKSRQGLGPSAKRARADQDEGMDGLDGDEGPTNGAGTSIATPRRMSGTVKTSGSRRASIASPDMTGAKSSRKTTVSKGALPSHSLQLIQGAEDDTKATNDKHKGWSVSSTVGGRYLSLDPQFTSDGKFLVAAKKHEVRLLSLDHSLVQDTISAPEGSAITGFSTSPAEPSRIYVGFSNPSRVEQWDWTEKSTATGVVNVDGQIISVSAAVTEDSGEEYVYTLASGSPSGSRIARNGKLIYESQSRMFDINTFGNIYICASPDKLLFGALHETGSQETVFDLAFTATSLTIRKHAAKPQSKKQSTSFDVALGASTGEVFVYENVVLDSTGAVKGSLPKPRTLHWHREAVQSLKWARDGNYLISGGRETVLVIWQLSSGKKQFLPHLSAEIEHITISPSGTSYAMQLADNSLMVLSTSELKPIAHFPDIQPQLDMRFILKSHDVVTSGQIDTVLGHFRMAGAVHPTEQDSLLLTIPASASAASTSIARPFLQSFSISAQRHQYRQALTRNSLTDLNSGPNGRPIQSPDASHLAVSPDGKVLVTVESWTPPTNDFSFLALDEKLDQTATQTRQEVYLKFWNWDEVNSRWSLETRVSNPHPLASSLPGSVFDLVADPTGSRFFTLGADNSVRLWTHKPSDWTCKSSITLSPSTTTAPVSSQTPLSSAQIASLAVSSDASLVACSLPALSPVSTTSHIHLISTTSASGSIKLQTSRLLPPVAGHTHALAFTARHLVVLATLSLTLIDIPTLAHTATYPLHPPRDRVPLAQRHRHLALTAIGLAAIAIPTSSRKTPVLDTTESESGELPVAEPWTRIEVYATSSDANKAKGRLFDTKIPGVVMGLYARRRGWVAVTADGRVVGIEPPAERRGVLERIKSRKALAQEGEEEGEKGVVLVDDEPVVGRDVTEEVDDDNDVQMVLEAGDKPVVRPEQLATVFESRAGVRDMFEGVMGLFSRRALQAV